MRTQVVITKTRVVLDRNQLAALLMNNSKARALVERMRARLDEEHELLLTALHELALAQEKEPQLFTRRWIQQKRRDPDPVPMQRTRRRR